MLYEIYLQNGPIVWIAFRTSDKEEAEKTLESVKAQYVYLRILDDVGRVISLRCQSNKWVISPME
jgi:hypothetical protein